MAQGTHKGSFPDPTKIVLVISAHNVARTHHLFCGIGLKLVTRSRYLGGYISDEGNQSEWLGEKARNWADGVMTMAGVAYKHLQAA